MVWLYPTLHLFRLVRIKSRCNSSLLFVSVLSQNEWWAFTSARSFSSCPMVLPDFRWYYQFIIRQITGNYPIPVKLAKNSLKSGIVLPHTLPPTTYGYCIKRMSAAPLDRRSIFNAETALLIYSILTIYENYRVILRATCVLSASSSVFSRSKSSGSSYSSTTPLSPSVSKYIHSS